MGKISIKSDEMTRRGNAEWLTGRQTGATRAQVAGSLLKTGHAAYLRWKNKRALNAVRGYPARNRLLNWKRRINERQ